MKMHFMYFMFDLSGTDIQQISEIYFITRFLNLFGDRRQMQSYVCFLCVFSGSALACRCDVALYWVEYKSKF